MLDRLCTNHRSSTTSSNTKSTTQKLKPWIQMLQNQFTRFRVLEICEECYRYRECHPGYKCHRISSFDFEFWKYVKNVMVTESVALGERGDLVDPIGVKVGGRRHAPSKFITHSIINSRGNLQQCRQSQNIKAAAEQHHLEVHWLLRQPRNRRRRHPPPMDRACH